jgi:sulfatase maturation enzyme AslB (radical SAM superfamily)
MLIDKNNTQVEIAIEFTKFCNLKCHYCCQLYEHKSKSVISFRSFKIFMDIFFKKLDKFQKNNKNKINLDISLLGGELSVLYKENEYFKYFEYLKKLINEYNIKSTFVLLSNFTGDLKFFQQFINMKNNLLDIEIHLTFHETYFTTESKMKNAFNKLNNLNSEKSKIEIVFLENDGPDYTKMKFIFDKINSEIKLSKNIIIKYDKLLKVGKNENGNFGITEFELSKIANTNNSINLKYCNVLQFEFDISNLLVIDQCRDKKEFIMNWDIPNDFVKCEKVCPYPSLWENFIQLSPENYKKYKEQKNEL